MLVFFAACIFVAWFFLATAGMPWRDIVRCLCVLALAIIAIWILFDGGDSASTLPQQIGGER